MLEVGGDWHDAFPLDGDRLGLVVGDVVGRGIQAAAAMGQLRSATRAVASAELGGPGPVLAALDRFVAGLPLARMATLAYAEVDLARGAVRYACAGHPPPVLVPAEGEPTLLWNGRRPPLGVPGASEPAPDGEVTLHHGDRLLLYTDGLIERRAETLDVGLARLVATIGDSSSRQPQALLDEVVRILTAAEPADDVCALCISRER
jgi:serine/threonine-protein kinase RsbW